MVFVLTNDDGIDAPGLQSLQQAVAAIGHQAIIVAPKQQHSGCGHQVTTHRPLHLEQRAETAYAVEGTPVDCTRIALTHLNTKPEWVIAGVNAGGNLGTDIYISGTVAAIREAALHRVPGIAISQRIYERRPIDWDLATQLTIRVLDKLLQSTFQSEMMPGAFWNVNFPHLSTDSPEPEIVFCPLCTQPLPADYRVEGEYLYYAGEYGKRMRDSGSDVDVCFSGNISVTRLKI